MLKDSRKHFLLVDSVLTKLETEIRICIKNDSIVLFDLENKKWHTEKDTFIKNKHDEFDKKFESGEYGSDMYMDVYYDSADFIVKRIKFLLNYRYENIKNKKAN
ncbi:MAG TPA: hypothetical protein PK431_14375 [Chitinophagales bacterium]|nr:hypothetical protein [Chitinophagales bacterium]